MSAEPRVHISKVVMPSERNELFTDTRVRGVVEENDYSMLHYKSCFHLSLDLLIIRGFTFVKCQ